MKILFADDEETIRHLLHRELTRMEHEVAVCPNGETAIAALEKTTYDCVLVDLNMPGLSGLDVIKRAKELAPDTEAIVLTGKSTVESAIAALRFGAFDYLTKPCTLVELKKVLAQVAERRAMSNKMRSLERRVVQAEGATRLIGSGESIERVRRLISKVAPTDSTVLILGETGVGKELAARSVHEQSLRSQEPFVVVNCGALPESLIESELFGHCKGAFTGADQHRAGLFEVANGGTLFLDEIGELPKAMQAKLLRALESGEIRRLGDSQTLQIDVRVVCATHRDLDEMTQSGDFREDLMFRINTFEVMLPSLRERLDDIAELAEHLYRRRRGETPPGAEIFTPEVIAALRSHVWPGNVRELANVIEHATILCDQLPIDREHLPDHFDSRKLKIAHSRSMGPMTLRDMELQAIHESLDRHQGSKPQAAEELGVSLKTLYNKLNQAATMSKSA